MSSVGQMWTFALYVRLKSHPLSPFQNSNTNFLLFFPTRPSTTQANCGGTLFFFFVGLTDKFSWLIECVLLLCAVSNGLWWYMFNELHRSFNTQMVFAGGLGVSLLGAALHCRRPMPEPEDDDDDDDDSEDEELSEEAFLEKIKQEERELDALKKLQLARLQKVKDGDLVKRKNAKKAVKDEVEETSNF